MTLAQTAVISPITGGLRQSPQQQIPVSAKGAHTPRGTGVRGRCLRLRRRLQLALGRLAAAELAAALGLGVDLGP